MAEAQSDREVLTGYWLRLDKLAAVEWEAFYRLVRRALMRCPAPELAALPDTQENYIDEFFAEKLFFKAQRMSSAGIQSISGGALCRFFRNYLLDEVDRYKRNPLTENEPDDERGTEDQREDVLIDEYLASVQGFLAVLPPWALVMLRGHFCADDPVPMSKLCERIDSYHYKAQKLGVTVKKNAGGLIGYEHTMIGQWMESLGVHIVPENHRLMIFLLGVICREATAKLEGDAP